MRLKKLITLVVLMSFLNLIFYGCSAKTSVKILNEELDTALKERIVNVILPTGQTYLFTKYGAYYSKTSAKIYGKTILGSEINLNVDDRDLSEIRISKAETISLENIEQSKVKEFIFNDFSRKAADNYNWILNSAQGLIKGQSEHKSIEINVDDIREIRTSLPKTVGKDEIAQKKELEITELIYQNKVVIFDSEKGKLIPERNVVKGVNDREQSVEIPKEDILYVRIERTDYGKAFIATVGVLALTVGVLFLIIALTKESCPFVYSYDSEKFVLDAEPLGGAISKGLQKTDFSRLEHVQDVEDKYRLMFRNEVEEIQYLDEIKLLYFDHDSTESVIPNPQGEFFISVAARSPLSSYDENGVNLHNFFKARDDVAWQTFLPRDQSYRENPLRHKLTFKFSKPEKCDQANLIVNAGTALWGSNMIREMLQLRGANIDQWYAGIDNHGQEFNELYSFINREELYLLKIYVKTDSGWMQQGFIPGGGPLITEDRILPLDLSNISGDEVVIELNPPLGFWTIDYVALEYDSSSPIEMSEISAEHAVDHDNALVADKIDHADFSYHIMHNVGDWLDVKFRAPKRVPNKERSIFLKTNGYYVIQIDKSRPEKTELIRDLIATPGKIVDYAMGEYLKWRLTTSN